MAQEIERKFLVKGEEWRNLGTGEVYRQGYFPTEEGCTIRVRVVGERGYLTIKGKTQGVSRTEFEYGIPVSDAEEMLEELCDRPLIEKIRYQIHQGDLLWEVDEFKGENEGLIVAEVELSSEDQDIFFPHWVGEDVSHDPRYYNINLMKFPYQYWQ
ncbi:CYTH domain-containing protein [Spirulina sp. CS-785/01]|uniref:CYTH domain-containing protein n=1 Tax=Spirulina sp. CS-785/01 TaxID=3021716 RepID=UPI00232DB9A0|nr:CYTH domain-containing protein [Spirulina sp. CS-785/01]MDB9312585.1 CYTH domain-containing protein [Spirulina sp. CS-785/01]